MAHKPWDLSLSVVPWDGKQNHETSCSHFSDQGSYYTTHMLGLNFTMKSWAESLALTSVIMHGPYLKRTQLLCVIWRYSLWIACPRLPWSAVAFSRSLGTELDSEICSSKFRIHSFNLNIRYMVGRTGHTRTRVLQCSHASVGLAQAHPKNHSSAMIK